MKYIISIIILFSVGQATAQRFFYLRLKVENKINQGLSDKPQTKSFFNNKYSTEYEDMPYGTVSASPFVTSKTFSLGINIGAKFRNNDLIEFGWNEDRSGSRIVLTSLGYNANYPDTYFMSNLSSHSVNLISHRFELLYYKNIRNKTDLEMLNFPKMYFVFGTGFKYLPSAVTPKNPHNGFIEYNDSGSFDNYRMDWEHQVFGWKKFSSFFTLGYCFEWNFNQTYLFSTSVMYTVGFNVLQSTKDKLSVYENDALVNTYNYETYSRGSGFQLQISRTFQVYPKKNNGKNPKKNIE